MTEYPYKKALDAVRYLMLRGGWWSEATMRQGVLRLTGTLYSGSGITARIRDLKQEFTIVKRPVFESRAFEYRIEKAKRERKAA
jgi:hypothetical protein